MNTISTYAEAKTRYVVEPIEASSEVNDAAAEYAIAAECIAWHDAYDEAAHVHHLDQQGYYLKPEFGGIAPTVDTLDEDAMWIAQHDAFAGVDAFWDLVQRHAR